MIPTYLDFEGEFDNREVLISPTSCPDSNDLHIQYKIFVYEIRKQLDIRYVQVRILVALKLYLPITKLQG